MPLFEFQCRQCSHRYELLVRGAETTQCPECGSPKAEKLLSAAAAHVGGAKSLPITSNCPPPDAPPCGPGCCRLD